MKENTDNFNALQLKDWLSFILERLNCKVNWNYKYGVCIVWGGIAKHIQYTQKMSSIRCKCIGLVVHCGGYQSAGFFCFCFSLVHLVMWSACYGVFGICGLCPQTILIQNFLWFGKTFLFFFTVFCFWWALLFCLAPLSIFFPQFKLFLTATQSASGKMKRRTKRLRKQCKIHTKNVKMLTWKTLVCFSYGNDWQSRLSTKYGFVFCKVVNWFSEMWQVRHWARLTKTR